MIRSPRGCHRLWVVLGSPRFVAHVPQNDLSHDVANAADALQFSLRRLTDRLTSASSGGVMDVDMIAHTAEAISKVLQALVQVQHIQKTNGA